MGLRFLSDVGISPVALEALGIGNTGNVAVNAGANDFFMLRI